MTVEINGKRYVERWEYYDLDTTKRKLEKENKTNAGLVKYWKAQYEEQKKEIKNRDELIRYYKKKTKDLKTEIGKLIKGE